MQRIQLQPKANKFATDYGYDNESEVIEEWKKGAIQFEPQEHSFEAVNHKPVFFFLKLTRSFHTS